MLPAPAAEEERTGAQAAGDDRTGAHVDPLVSLQQQSMELGKVALMGSGDPGPQRTASPLLLLKYLEHLKEQKFALVNKIRSDNISLDNFPSENLTKEYWTETIASLKTEIEHLKMEFHNKSLVLHRIQLYDAIQRKLLEKNTESKHVSETIEHSAGLCRRIQRSQKETIALEEKVIAVRKKRMELKETCETLMTELKSLKENANQFTQIDSETFRNTSECMAKELDIVTLIQNILQRLVLGSGINWAEDPKLKEIVLKLGMNPACF